MPSTSEVGHSKNVANFQDLITACNSFGSAYNPSNTTISITSLNTIYSNADNLIDNVDTANEQYHSAVGSRRNEFDTLKALSTKLLNAYIAVNPGKAKVANAKTINAKIQGTKLKKVKEVTVANNNQTTSNPPAETPKEISASQQSYDQQVEHFSKLVVLLAADPLFIPNEMALQTTTLNAKLVALKTTNTNIGITYTQVTNTRIARDHSLYDATTGLCDVAQTVKAYVKSLFGASSPEFKMVNKIEFKKRKL